MATEKQEQKATNHALDILANWMKAGTNEGISFEISRLTDDLFTDPLLGGGDASRFTASGRRATLTGQLAKAYILDSHGREPPQYPIPFTFHQETRKRTGHWNSTT